MPPAMRKYTLRFALSKATEDYRPLSSDLIGDILSLNELMQTAPSHRDAADWMRDTLRKTTKGSRSDSVSDRSVDMERSRPREDPLGGQGDNKHATTSGHLDKDSSKPR